MVNLENKIANIRLEETRSVTKILEINLKTDISFNISGHFNGHLTAIKMRIKQILL